MISVEKTKKLFEAVFLRVWDANERFILSEIPVEHGIKHNTACGKHVFVSMKYAA
jgi:hypothetical protein